VRLGVFCTICLRQCSSCAVGMADSLVDLCGNMTLLEGEQVGLVIHEDDTVDLRLKRERCLVGRLLTERRIQKDAFRVLMSKLWRTMGSVLFKEIDENLWLFEFASESDKRRVTEGRPWLFDRSFLVLRDVDELTPPNQMDFHLSPIWVQVHDMPLTCMNRAVGNQIRGSLGSVLEVDVTGDGVGWGRFLRIQVVIDLTKPLDRGRALIMQGKSLWVTFRYEKLPSFCHHCGRIFHGAYVCDKRQGYRLNEDGGGKQWGLWMRAAEYRDRRGGLAAASMKNTDHSNSKEEADESVPPAGDGEFSFSGRFSSKDKFDADCSGTKNAGIGDSSNPNHVSRDDPNEVVGAGESLPKDKLAPGREGESCMDPLRSTCLDPPSRQLSLAKVDVMKTELAREMESVCMGEQWNKEGELTGPELPIFHQAGLEQERKKVLQPKQQGPRLGKAAVNLIGDVLGGVNEFLDTKNENEQMQIDKQKRKPVARNWKRRARAPSMEGMVSSNFFVPSEKRKVQPSPEPDPNVQMGRIKKGKSVDTGTSKLALAEAVVQPREPQ